MNVTDAKKSIDSLLLAQEALNALNACREAEVELLDKDGNYLNFNGFKIDPSSMAAFIAQFRAQQVALVAKETAKLKAIGIEVDTPEQAEAA